MEVSQLREVEVGKTYALETALGDLLKACVAGSEVERAMGDLVTVIEERGEIPRRLIKPGKSQSQAWKIILNTMAPIPGKKLKQGRAENGSVIGSKTRALFQNEPSVAAKIISIAARVIRDYQIDHRRTANQVALEFNALRSGNNDPTRSADNLYGIVEQLGGVVGKQAQDH